MASPAVLGNNTLIKVNAIDLSGDLNQVKIAFNAGEADVSTFGATGWKSFIATLSDYMLDLTGFFNKAASKSDAILFALFGAPAGSTSFEVDIPNNVTGSIKYTGNSWGKVYSPDSKVNGPVGYTAQLRGTDAPTRAVI